MNRKSMAALALSGAMLLGVTGSASALNTGNRPTTWRQNDASRVRTNDAQKDQRRALRQRIQLQHSEYKAFRKAGDPRARESYRRYQALKADYQRIYGGDRDDSRRDDGKKRNKSEKHNGHSKHDRD